METVNNIVNTATKMVWGEKTGEEPVNSSLGAGTINEPYDKGNEETTATTSSTAPGSTLTPATDSTSIPTTGSTSTSATDSTSTPDTDNRINSTAPKTTETDNPAASGAVPHQKQQGADRPNAEPSDAQTAAVKEKKEAAEATQQGSDSAPHHITDSEREKLAQEGNLPHDPNDHSGEPMHMHAGGAAKDSSDPRDEAAGKPKDRTQSVSQEGGGEHGKEKGTGEKWIKTNGMAAEGGDFDATKPGAGREATRLMEEKGIKTEGATLDKTASPTASTKSPSGDDKAKVSKIAKLKDKLHIGSGKNE